MEKKSRTEYSAVNTTVAMVARVVAILAGYLTRVVFTHVLSEDYVGINGLFTDVLNVLALSELGVGTAITYALYRPISQGDIEKQKSLMRLYRRFYRIVAGVVLTAGLLLIPFLDVLIKDQPDVDHLILIYLMYLFNSVVSYLLIYKRTLIDAHQLSYIGVLYQTVFLIIQNAAQIWVLLATGNFILFLSILILCTLGGNLAISRRANLLYPYLKDRNVQPLKKEERGEIYRNIRAMLLHKIGNVLVNNTDNLLLSALVGTLSVGRYSNYFLIIGSVRQVLNQMFQGITASVGNLGVEESRERMKRIFEAAFFVGQWIFGLAAICLFEVLDPFVELSFGSSYVFPASVTLVLCLNFYLTGMRQATLVFRDSMGIFTYDRYKAIPEALINLGASLLLGHYLGALGIFLGTMISTVTTSLWVEPYMLYKHQLQTSSRPYFRRYLLYAAVTCGTWLLCDLLCGQIRGGLGMVCLLRLLICFVLADLVFLLVYFRTGEFRLLTGKAAEILRRHGPGLFGWRERIYERNVSAEERRLLRMLAEALAGRREPTAGRRETPAGRREPTKGRRETSESRRETPARAGRGRQRGVQGKDADVDWEALADVAGRHGVLPLLYDSLAKAQCVPEAVRREVTVSARSAVRQSYRILFLCKYLIGRLEEAGIAVALLKGVGTASFYPQPELRKTGDVDLLLLEPEKQKDARRILLACGLAETNQQRALHHIVYQTPESIEVELHTMLAEPFDNHRINQYLRERVADCGKHLARADCMGVPLPILAGAYHAYELLLHMLQHFLRSGFGLKLLCDWTVFWNRDTAEQERQEYMSLVRESGLSGFSDMVTLFCCTYLGLPAKRVEWMNIPWNYDVKIFRREILDAEEFGKSAKDRMVTMRGNGLLDYLREFHHQMCLNFPRGSRCFLGWPFLWAVTLARFLRNNRRIRQVSARSILKKAGQRSHVMEEMHLWKQEDNEQERL